MIRPMLAALLLMPVIGSAEAAGPADSFDRPASNIPGTMSDGVHNWYQLESYPASVRIQDNQLVCDYDAGVGESGVAIEDYQIIDGIIKATFAGVLGSETRFGIIGYRAGSLDSAIKYNGEGYHVRLFCDWAGDMDVGLYYGPTLLASANIGDKRPDKIVCKVTFRQDSHVVAIDEAEVIHYAETAPGRNKAGHIGLGTSWKGLIWDDFQVTSEEQ